MRGMISRPLGQMREYAGHLFRQSILDFSPSSCACSLWHSPPLHSDLSWLCRLFYFINIHYLTYITCITKKSKVTRYILIFSQATPFIGNLTEIWYHISLILFFSFFVFWSCWCSMWAAKCYVGFPKNFPLSTVSHVDLTAVLTTFTWW